MIWPKYLDFILNKRKKKHVRLIIFIANKRKQIINNKDVYRNKQLQMGVVGDFFNLKLPRI